MCALTAVRFPILMDKPQQRTRTLAIIASRLQAYFDNLKALFAHDAEKSLTRAEHHNTDQFHEL